MKTERLQCDFCWRLCRLKEGETGWCTVRANRNGALVTLGYGEVVSLGVDPIEKKPLYHFLPGSRTLSVALFGCNFRCSFCQNYQISQPDSPYAPQESSKPYTSPRELIETMEKSRVKIMTYTYSDPVVWQDYMLDTAAEVRRRGGVNCMITNGSFSPGSLQRALPLIDAFNIDLKGSESFYRQWCSGSLRPVLESIETIAEDRDTVLEVTTLVIEGIHSLDDIAELGKMLSDAGVRVWHLSRFYPTYLMTDRPQTSETFLGEALRIAGDSGIDHIYAGNSTGADWQETRCPGCGRRLISSHSYSGEAGRESARNIREGRCTGCGTEIYGRFS